MENNTVSISFEEFVRQINAGVKAHGTVMINAIGGTVGIITPTVQVEEEKK
jgi:hypothetical protein